MHSGGIPGFSTHVVFLPSDGLGFVTLGNADAKHAHELVAIYRIIEDYLGLDRKYSTHLISELRAQNEPNDKQVDDIHPPSGRARATAPPLPLAAYAGIYGDPGYPNITLCIWTSNSPECTAALEDFAHFEDITDSQTLYAIIPSAWVSQGRAWHKEGNRFALAATLLFPHGYGKDQSPFEMGDDGELPAEFVLDESGSKVLGVAVNGFVGETTELQRIGGTVEETAEVYLRKLD